MQPIPEIFKYCVLHGTTKNSIYIFAWVNNKIIPDFKLTNENIVSESLKLTAAICDDTDLKFGGCIASTFEIEVVSEIDLTGKYISVINAQKADAPLYPGLCAPTAEDCEDYKVYPSRAVARHDFSMFSGEVYSSKLSKSRITRKVIAYDRFYSRGSINCTAWYRKWCSHHKDYNGKVKLGDLRKAVLRHFAMLEQAARDMENNDNNDPVTVLPADEMTVNPLDDEVTACDILRQICEFNGCFMYFNGRGNIEYSFVGNGKFANGAHTETYDYYMDFESEDFSKSAYTGFYIENRGYYRFTGDDTDNLYYLENELITNGCDSPTLDREINNYREAIKPNFDISYTPSELTAESRLWVDLGDRLNVCLVWFDLGGKRHEETVSTLALSRTISGINAMKDEFTAGGEKVRYTDDSTEDEG